jgi:hypothetical protein
MSDPTIMPTAWCIGLRFDQPAANSFWCISGHLHQMFDDGNVPGVILGRVLDDPLMVRLDGNTLGIRATLGDGGSRRNNLVPVSIQGRTGMFSITRLIEIMSRNGNLP